MSTQPTLPLSLLCDVVMQVSPTPVATPTFNQGLVVGSSAVIPSVGGNTSRLRSYTSPSALLADGFSANSPEYIAAEIYFSVTPTPVFLWVGRQDLTSIQSANPHLANAGTGYAVGDIITVTQAGASHGQLTVTAVGSNGAVTALATTIGNQGTGYSVASGLATTGGSGNSLEVDITAIGETPLQAVQACRSASPMWWEVVCLNAVAADHIALGNWASSASPQAYYAYETQDANIIPGTLGNVMATLKAQSCRRAMGIYSTTQGGLYATNVYAAVAKMAVAMGLNTGLNGSAFTMKFKQLPGISTEPLSLSQIQSIEGQNGNVYLSYADAYQFFEQGVSADGTFFDQVLNRDMLMSDIQYSIVNAFQANVKVPQTNDGQQLLNTAVRGACQRAVARGYIGTGTWTGNTILQLSSGDPLPSGFLVQSASFTTQSAGDRAARKMMPIYVSLIEAGAGHSITIGVLVQQ